MPVLLLRCSLPEMRVRLLSFVSGSLLQAARMQTLDLGIHFMFNFSILQQDMWFGDPLLNYSILVVAIVVELLAC